MPKWRVSGNYGRIAVDALLGVALTIVVIITASKVIFEPPEHDEAELLHASWLIAHGGKVWVDFFENHAALYMAVNSWIFDTDSILYVLYAKYVHLLV